MGRTASDEFDQAAKDFLEMSLHGFWAGTSMTCAVFAKDTAVMK